jgi:hypothetical protein
MGMAAFPILRMIMCGKRPWALLGFFLCVSLLMSMSAERVNAEVPLAVALAAAAPSADPNVLKLAVAAVDCATAHGISPSQRLAVIDYSRASTEPRLWVFDLKRRALLYRELVAHGRNTGDNFARAFSNNLGSLQSSLGLFRTLDTYQGSNGYSLRMDGLESGVNDNALERAIVMHGAPYVTPELARTQGRVGRSWGCPAVRQGVARQMIDALKGGQFLFSYYPDQKWLGSSSYLHCRANKQLAQSS